jgi:hypothetical protein
MGMGIGMFALQCAAEFEYGWNVGLQNVRLTSFECRGVLGRTDDHVLPELPRTNEHSIVN